MEGGGDQILTSETRALALEKNRSHFTDGKTLPRFTALLNIEKVVSDVPFGAPRKPRAKGCRMEESLPLLQGGPRREKECGKGVDSG